MFSPAILYAGLLSLISCAAAGEIVDLGYAKYRGNVSYPNTVAFLGLPYAEPPLGERRWRAPVPLDAARVTRQTRGRVIDASKKPTFCIQGTTGAGDAGGAGSEDCLLVNVYAPFNAKKGDKLPVLVYFHGGGYYKGNPTSWHFDHWINQVPDVVIVSVYYRLKSLGFLSHPAFSDSRLADNNVGFLDQNEALRWVQKHINAFGGDSKRVTINGQSAGGSSVELHLVAPGNKGLFSQAIAQSVYRVGVTLPEQQLPQFNFFAEQAGCARPSIGATLSCLRTASVSAIARAQDAPFNGSFAGFNPVLDAKSINVQPTTSILQGNFIDVPLIVGSTSNESLSGEGNFHTSLKTFFPLLTDEDLGEYDAEYPLSDFDSEGTRARVATGESELRCAAEIMGRAFSSKKSKTYVYRYDTRNPTRDSLLVEHAAESWMMFKGTNTGFNGTATFSPMNASETAFAEELIAYWLSFVRSGDPNAHKLARAPQWPLYNTGSTQRIVLTEGTESVTGSTLETIPALEQRRCEFVASKARVQQA